MPQSYVSSQFRSIPLRFDYIKLQTLDCQNTGIADLSPVATLTSLQILCCWGTKIDSLSPIAALANLQTLDCSKTIISDLSPIATIINLKNLNFSGTKVSDLTPICKLTNLQRIECKNNQVHDLSKIDWEPFEKLEVLDFYESKIKDLLPIKILIQNGLSVVLNGVDNGIRVLNCPLVHPPPEIVKKGNVAILNYFAEREKHQFKNTEIKLILTGNSTAGKTSLSRYLRERKYNPALASTHGIENYRWEPEGHDLQVNCWDFGGQEYYHATHRLFLSRNAVYTLVWDAETDKGGFCDTPVQFDLAAKPVKVRLEHFPQKWWMRNIRHLTRDSTLPVPVLMVQNKSARDGERRVSSEFEEKPFLLDVASLNNHIDIEAVADLEHPQYKKWLRRFEDFEERLLEKLQSQLAEFTFAVYHRDIRDKVRELAAENTTDLPYADFEQLCRNIEANASMDLVVIYLCNIRGDILYFDQNPRLKDRVFLRPAWVCEQIYRILSRQVLTQNGIFNMAWVREALHVSNGVTSSHPVATTTAEDFVALMREFELVFEESDENGQPNGRFVAPQYLPETCAKLEYLEGLKADGILIHAFTLWFPEFLPKSHLARFVAHWGDRAEGRIFWKNGLLFKTAGCKVLAEHIGGGKIRVDIQTTEKHRRETTTKRVFQSFQVLEDGNPGFAVSLNGEDFVLWSELEGARDKKQQQVSVFPLNSKKLIDFQPFQTFTGGITKAKKIFISYSRHDRAMFLEPMLRYLNTLVRGQWIQPWDDSKILPGEEWNESVKTQLKEADIILLLVSTNLLNTDYIWNVKIEAAMQRHEEGTAKVIPIILSKCLWTEKSQEGNYVFPPAKLNALPQKGKPVDEWERQNDAWDVVAKGIKLFLQQA